MLVRDPGEIKNLATGPRHAGVLVEHRRRLKARIEELGDDYGRSLWKAAGLPG